MGIERSTFLIDPQGKIAQIYPKVKVKEHVADVLTAVLGEDSIRSGPPAMPRNSKVKSRDAK